MRLTARRWVTAFAVAVLVHAAGVAVLLRLASEPGAGAAGPGVTRVSLGQAGGAPTSAATEPSGVPEVEMTTAVETTTSSPIDEAVPTEVPATTMAVAAVDVQTVAQADAPDDAVPVEAFDTSEPEAIAVAEPPAEEAATTEVPAGALPVEEAALAEAPPTPNPVETLNVEAVAQDAAPQDVVPVETVEQAVNSEASEPETIVVVETVVDLPVEEAAPVEVPAAALPVEEVASAEVPATPNPVETVNVETVAQDAAPQDAVPVEAAEQAVNSRASESETAPVAESVVGPPVEEAVPTQVPAAALPVEEVASAEVPATPNPVETVNVETVAQNAALHDAVPIEAPEPVVSSEAAESAAITVAETAVASPVEEVAPTPAEPVGQAYSTADAIEAGVVVPAEALAGPAPVEAIETIARQAESSETQPTAVELSDPEETTVAEAVTGPPIEEVISTSPEPVTPQPVAADSIEAEMAAPVEAAAGPAPPDAEVRSVERVPSVRNRSAHLLASAATSEPREEAAERMDIVAPSSGESDAGRSAMPVTGSGTRVETVGDPAAHHGYLTRVLERIARFKRYPREARRDGVVGKVMVRFTVLADGSLQSPRLAGSSGDNRLDQAALQMLSRASPFPPIPRSLGVGKLELSLPVQFSLNQKRTLF